MGHCNTFLLIWNEGGVTNGTNGTARVAAKRQVRGLAAVAGKFMTDIKSVLADAEDLLKQAANTSGERAAELSGVAPVTQDRRTLLG
ncbi:hypothetical protein UC34_25515 (plasmid) [Pandoraea vervacti]|uniref:DUF883 domain-containing protein n=1 Tax=Pandoraea vervacti TaxID=656178 RepID=A0ABN4U7X8_9BURK|nr:hypothetical protein UC34_25515 [Pandoraea vervacti]